MSYTPPNLSVNIVLSQQTAPPPLIATNVVLCAPTVIPSRKITLGGFDSSFFSEPYVFNKRQFVIVQGDEQSLYGEPYLQGGVNYFYPDGIDSSEYGDTVIGNTTANQYAYPSGIDSPDIPLPDVSPRTLYAQGFYNGVVGVPNISTPALLPNGFSQSAYGIPTIWFHTREITPTGWLSYQSGYLAIADPAQTIYPPSFVQSAVFGDIAIRNLSSVINVPAINDGAFSDYSTLTNNSRFYTPIGIDSLRIGDVSINNGTPELSPTSFNTHVVGLPAIGYRIRQVTPIGFDGLLLGEPIATKTPELFPSNFQSSVFGDASITHGVRYIQADGIDQAKYGTPTVWFRYRYVGVESWQSSVFDRPTVTHGVREIIVDGFNEEAYGDHWLSRGTRLIEPVSIYKEFPSNHFVGRHQEIKPYGFIATLFGERIIPISNTIYPQGMAGAFGLADLSFYTRYLMPVGYITVGTQPADRWGQITAYNLTQYVQPSSTDDSGLAPPKWSDWQSIENKDKVLGVVGHNSLRLGYTKIDNNAAPLLPLSINPPVVNGGMISHAIRVIALEGIEPIPMSAWTVVYNDARVIAPTGIVHTLMGDAEIIKTRRYYSNVGRIDSLETGTPMIAYRIRTIDIESRYSIAPPYIQLPTIDLYTRYVSLRGYETARYGSASLSVHFNIIKPTWNHKEKFGTPALRNLTPELLINGHDSNEFGQVNIRTQWRNVYAQGDNANVFGLHKISDTKQYIEVRGWRDIVVSQKHEVVKTGTNPYVTQNIYLNDESGQNNGEGYGISNPYNIGRPSINQNVLYHEGHKSSTFGIAFVWSNNIVIDSGIAIDGVSTGAWVSNKNNVISLADKGIDNTIAAGRPRLSPHTIWAVNEAPEQAKANHPVSNPHYVGSGDGGPAGARLGRPSIESTIRSILPYGLNPSSDQTIGSPSLDLSIKVIKPDSFRVARFGVPSIPFTPQTIELRDGIHDPQWGDTEVSVPPYIGPQTIEAEGLNSFESGQHYSDNFIREILVDGYDSLEMGQSKYGDTPFMWQGLRIGEHVPIIIGGDDMSSYGNAFISLRVREVSAQGFNAFSSGYSIESFAGRMTVKNADKKLPMVRNIGVSGIESNNIIGYQDIKLGQRYIRPDGNSDQFRKGGYDA